MRHQLNRGNYYYCWGSRSLSPRVMEIDKCVDGAKSGAPLTLSPLHLLYCSRRSINQFVIGEGICGGGELAAGGWLTIK